MSKKVCKRKSYESDDSTYVDSNNDFISDVNIESDDDLISYVDFNFTEDNNLSFHKNIISDNEDLLSYIDRLSNNDSNSITVDTARIKSSSRYISNKKKYELYQKYNGKCANNPINPIINDYECPMWKLYDGSFDKSGYQIDHIIEFSLSKNNDIDNLQPLCHCCHSVKTKNL